jgi:hypothetical protein
MRRRLSVLVLVWLIAQAMSASSFAEDQKTSTASTILIPGVLSRVESYGPMGYWRLCAPQSIGLNDIGFVERLIRPTPSQMELLSRLQVASAAAMNVIASSCAKETVSTGPVHFAEMQKRVAGLLESIKVIREPYEAFYASLDNRQKALLDNLGPSRHGWGW